MPKKEGHVLVNTEKYVQIDLSRSSQNASDLYLKKTTKDLYGTIKGGQNWINLQRDYAIIGHFINVKKIKHAS